MNTKIPLIEGIFYFAQLQSIKLYSEILLQINLESLKVLLYLQSLYSVGEILKRPTRADCKSADYVFAGSNPALPTNKYYTQKKPPSFTCVVFFVLFQLVWKVS